MILELLFVFLLGKCLVVNGKPMMNVIIVIADDLGFADTSFNYRLHHDENEQPPIHTPHLDYLAENGVILKNMYVHPHCAASRCALLTSRYNIRLGDPFPIAGVGGLNLKFKTLADEFKQRGYQTMHIGKWGIDSGSGAYVRGNGGPVERGFDRFFGLINSGHDHFNKHVISKKRIDLHEYNLLTGSFKEYPEINNEPTIHSSDLFGRKAVEYITENGKDKPFFLQLSFTAPHDPLLANATEAAKPTCTKLKGGWRRRTYCGMVVGVDTNIGRVVNQLHYLGIANNTIIYFMSDNGGHFLVGANNSPLRGAKVTLWEGGVRVPSFFHSPAIFGKPRVLTGPVHVTDIAITLLKLVDKLSAVNLVENKEESNNDDVENKLKSMRMMKVKSYPSLLGKIDGIDFSAALLESTQATVTTHRKEFFVGGSIFSNTSSYVVLPYKLTVGRIGDSRLVEEPVSEWSINNGTMLDMMEEIIVNTLTSISTDLFPFEWSFHFLIEHIRDIIFTWSDPSYSPKAGADIPYFFQMHNFDRKNTSLPIPWPGVSITENTPVYLYDIVDDPLETKNLAKDKPDVVQSILKRMSEVLSDSEDQEKAVPVFFGWMMMVECIIFSLAFFLFLLALVFFIWYYLSASASPTKQLFTDKKKN